jgi:hypothetical protein
MSKPPYYKTLSGPQTFVWRMFLFLVLTGLIAAIIHEQIQANFNKNQALNALIIGVLIFGILFIFQQVLRLYPEVRWVNSFRISDPGLAMDHVPVMLAPMAMMLRRRQGRKPRNSALSRWPSHLPWPARHILGPASNDGLSWRYHRCAEH